MLFCHSDDDGGVFLRWFECERGLESRRKVREVRSSGGIKATRSYLSKSESPRLGDQCGSVKMVADEF